MSLTFCVICPETKQKIWVGQGHHHDTEPVMEAFYSCDPDVMEKLHRFLKATQGKDLKLICEEHMDEEYHSEYKEFT
jgi:hypothetical protein